MKISQSYLLTLTLALGDEYCLKQWWEIVGSQFAKPISSYFLYRLVRLVLLTSTGYVLFTHISLSNWVVFSIALVVLGSIEVPLRLIINRIRKATGVYLYQLNYLVPLSIILLCGTVDYVLRYDVNYGLIFLFVFLAHPSNYLIRWALNRDESDFKNQAKSEQANISKDLAMAYREFEYAEAKDKLLSIAKRLEHCYPKATASLLEGL